MEIRQLWPVNIVVDNLRSELNNQLHQSIIDTVKHHENTSPFLPQQLMQAQVGSCLLKSACPGIQYFRSLLLSRMRYYLQVEGFPDWETAEIDAWMFGRVMHKGQRTRTHCHRGCDYVAVFYVDLDVTDTGGPSFVDDVSGRFNLLDPISYRSRRLNHTQSHVISPVPGTLVIHPSHVFHESDTYHGDRERILVVTNMRIRESMQMPNFVLL
jgi:hypothetical protein